MGNRDSSLEDPVDPFQIILLSMDQKRFLGDQKRLRFSRQPHELPSSTIEDMKYQKWKFTTLDCRSDAVAYYSLSPYFTYKLESGSQAVEVGLEWRILNSNGLRGKLIVVPRAFPIEVALIMNEYLGQPVPSCVMCRSCDVSAPPFHLETGFRVWLQKLFIEHWRQAHRLLSLEINTGNYIDVSRRCFAAMLSCATVPVRVCFALPCVCLPRFSLTRNTLPSHTRKMTICENMIWSLCPLQISLNFHILCAGERSVGVKTKIQFESTCLP